MTGPRFRTLADDVYVRMKTCSHSPDEWSGAIVGFGAPVENLSELSDVEFARLDEGVVSWCQECAGATWELHSLDPLHIEPSVLRHPTGQHPGRHGFIREGRWVEA